MISNKNLRAKALIRKNGILLIDKRNNLTRRFAYQPAGAVRPEQLESSLERLLCREELRESSLLCLHLLRLAPAWAGDGTTTQCTSRKKHVFLRYSL